MPYRPEIQESGNITVGGRVGKGETTIAGLPRGPDQGQVRTGTLIRAALQRKEKRFSENSSQ